MSILLLLAWSSEDSQYVTTCPEFGQLMALADTRLAWQAKIEGVSLNTFVCSLLSEASSQLTAAGYLSSRFASTYHGAV